MELFSTISFADLSVEQRKVKSVFFNQIDAIIDWKLIENEITKNYKKGKSADGRPSYSGLLLFKITLLQTWYGLSDYEVEDSVNDRISFSKFLKISLDDKCPDHSVISRFRTELTKKNVYENLLKLINEQLEKHEIIVKTGVIIDASITDSPRKPRGKKQYEVVENDTENQTKELNKVVEIVQNHVDIEGKWIIKAKKIRYGYKKHCVTDNNGLILGLVTTAANVNEISNLEEVLDSCALEKGTKIKADKGYKSQKNDKILKEKGFKNQVMFKATKNKKLSHNEIKFNILVSKTRYKIERTFGSIKSWFKGGAARYVGKAKTHTQHIMEAIAYNLYRSPKILMSNL